MNETGGSWAGAAGTTRRLPTTTASMGSTAAAGSGPVFVLSHRPQDAPDDPKATFVSGIDEALARARDAAGGKNVEIFGANVARQCLDVGFIDEVVVHLAPILLGDGVRL